MISPTRCWLPPRTRCCTTLATSVCRLKMNPDTLQDVPRVSVTDLRTQSHPTDVWELASENLTLSMCRHNVCVLVLPQRSSGHLTDLFTSLDSLLQAPPPGPSSASEEEPGLAFLPGRHSYNFKVGPSKADSLTEPQSDCFHRVLLSMLLCTCDLKDLLAPKLLHLKAFQHVKSSTH